MKTAMSLNLKHKIQKAIEEKGKSNFSKQLRKDAEFVKELNLMIPNDIPFIEKVVAVYSEQNPYCEKGQKKKYLNIFDGFGFCGKTGKCVCAQEHVASSVSKTKLAYTSEQRDSIQKKRENTNYQRYGVTNTGQTETALEKHRKFYENQENVKSVLEKQRNTFQIKYGPYITNAAHLEQHAMRMYSANNPMKNTESAKKAQQTKQIKYDENYYKRLSFLRIKELLHEKNIDLLVDIENYNGVNDNYNFRCLKCDYNWIQKLYRVNSVVCKQCHPTIYTYKSREENEVKEFLESLGVKVVQRNQSLIGQQLDLICPEYNIAIEYCGLYYHTELSKPNSNSRDKNYHLNKYKKAEENNYRLITIFSDEWKYKKEQVKQVLKHIFHKNQRSIGARKLIVKTITNNIAQEFMDLHHLQGWGRSSPCIGLLDVEGNVYAVMTFKKWARALNGQSAKDIDNNIYELVRYATNGYNVIGGADKLLKHFIERYQPKKIITYADKRWSQGKLYRTLGFTHVHDSPPNYWYTFDYEQRIHRFNFRKNVLVQQGYDPNKTEWEIMKYDLGYDRIWDCGNQRWEIEFPVQKKTAN